MGSHPVNRRVAVDLTVEQDEAGCSAQTCDWVTAAL